MQIKSTYLGEDLLVSINVNGKKLVVIPTKSISFLDISKMSFLSMFVIMILNTLNFTFRFTKWSNYERQLRIRTNGKKLTKSICIMKYKLQRTSFDINHENFISERKHHLCAVLNVTTKKKPNYHCPWAAPIHWLFWQWQLRRATRGKILHQAYGFHVQIRPPLLHSILGCTTYYCIYC